MGCGDGLGSTAELWNEYQIFAQCHLKTGDRTQSQVAVTRDNLADLGFLQSGQLCQLAFSDTTLLQDVNEKVGDLRLQTHLHAQIFGEIAAECGEECHLKKAIAFTVLFIASSDGIRRQPCIEMIRDNAPDAVHL